MNKILLLSIFSLLLVSFAFADSMWYDFTNDYATDGNAKFNVFVDADGDGLPDAGYDVNITMTVGNQDFIFQETTGNDGYAQFNFDFNHNGVLGKDGNEFQF